MPATADIQDYDYTFSVKLGARLRKLREERGLTQEEVAERAGIATYTYQKFENGESKPGTPMNPRLRTLVALSHVFGQRVCELLDIEDDEPPAAT